MLTGTRDWPLRLPKRGRPGCNRRVLTGTRDWPLRLPKRGRPGCNRRVLTGTRDWPLETAEERTARLQQMSANRHERLASETAEERTARLQQMSANQHKRLASETAEVRLQYYSDRHRELQVVQSQLPLFEQRSVHTKMLRFHAHMASLSNADNAPPPKTNPRICNRPYAEVEDFDQDLTDLVATCQRHTRCSAAYCLRTRNGQQKCRFGYPKPLQLETALVTDDGEPALLTAQTDAN